MEQELNAETPVEATEAAIETPEAEGQEAPAPAEGETTEGAEAPPRPREVIKGIHPELLCECPECAPEYTELQWFSPEEERKTKGSVMLYCQRSSRKYFSPATEFHAWVAEHATKKRRKD
ncbi:MAG: hypothetical protein ACLGIN_07900 [Candidatus Sericytochromatia bacterium]